MTGSISKNIYIYHISTSAGECASILGDVSVLKVCKLNTNYAIQFYYCSGKKIFAECLSRDEHMKTQFSWLLIHWLFNKRTVPLGENSCKFNYFIDGKV